MHVNHVHFFIFHYLSFYFVCEKVNRSIHAEVEDKDMYTAIDLLANKIERQIVKYKEMHMVNMHSTKVSD
jgi:ribosomal subunit interface protein